jgi:universal stress protein A
MAQLYGNRMKGLVDYRLIVLDGHVSTELINFLDDNPIDIVVLGAYGLSGMGLVIFGSVAKRVAHKAPCSVMIVRPRP